NLAWSRWVNTVSPSGYYEEHALDGRLVRTYSTPHRTTNPHDLQVLPDGSAFLVRYSPREGVDLRRLGGPRRATVLDGEVYEVDSAGHVVWTWSTAGHISLNESRQWSHYVI